MIKREKGEREGGIWDDDEMPPGGGPIIIIIIIIVMFRNLYVIATGMCNSILLLTSRMGVSV